MCYITCWYTIINIKMPNNNIYRNKLLNSIIYFTYLNGPTTLNKIFWFLYNLDFEHFRQTGYPSIGLKYYAFEYAPVPKDLWFEIKDSILPDDFKGNLKLREIPNRYNKTSYSKIPTIKHKLTQFHFIRMQHSKSTYKKTSTLNKLMFRIKVVAETEADMSYFSPREKNILEKTFEFYRSFKDYELSDLTSHYMPWLQTLIEKGDDQPIDYMLAIDQGSKIDKLEAKESLKEYYELMHNFSLQPTNE